jgi:hypothetical protein
MPLWIRLTGSDGKQTVLNMSLAHRLAVLSSGNTPVHFAAGEVTDVKKPVDKILQLIATNR